MSEIKHNSMQRIKSHAVITKKPAEVEWEETLKKEVAVDNDEDAMYEAMMASLLAKDSN